MFIDSEPPRPPDASAETYVEPDELDRQAGQWSELGDRLRQETVGTPQFEPPLGTAPPAQWFAFQLARLSGADGAAGMLRSWADGLARVGDNQRAAAKSYRETDDGGAGQINRSGSCR